MEMLEIKNVFNGFISQSDTAKERMNDPFWDFSFFEGSQ